MISLQRKEIKDLQHEILIYKRMLDNENTFCKHCKQPFKKKELHAHRTRCLYKIKNLIKVPCTVCGKEVGKGYLKAHLKNVHNV